MNNSQNYKQNLSPATRLGGVHLMVSNLDRSLDFYQQSFGLRLHHREGNHAALGTGGEDLSALTEEVGAHHPGRSTGLYHFAILVPTRLALAKSLRNLINTKAPILGFADHLVSEAIYLTDPDGSGIEIYCDRPRTSWEYQDGVLNMGTEPLDVEGLLAMLDNQNYSWDGLESGTKLGHMHLQVANLAEAQEFYTYVLGFDLVMKYENSAAFLSAGSYHHHIAVNTWQSLGAPAPAPGTTGLRNFSVVLADVEEMEDLIYRLEQFGYPYSASLGGLSVFDPSHNEIVFTLSGNGGILRSHTDKEWFVSKESTTLVLGRLFQEEKSIA
jgi:catechol 2,3-dioxygenase